MNPNVRNIAEMSFNQATSIVPTLLFTAPVDGFYRVTCADVAAQDVPIFTTMPDGADVVLLGTGQTSPTDNSGNMLAVVTSLYLKQGFQFKFRTDQNNPPAVPFDLNIVAEQI